MFLSENLQKKWAPVLDHDNLPSIKDNYKRAVTAVVLENQEKALREEKATPTIQFLSHWFVVHFQT